MPFGARPHSSLYTAKDRRRKLYISINRFGASRNRAVTSRTSGAQTPQALQNGDPFVLRYSPAPHYCADTTE